MLDNNVVANLLQKARAAREAAYAPYSGFRVGAALLTASGSIYTGCNVENASFGATICAERSAVSAAVSAGEREFRAIALTAGGSAVTPCGICRQVLSEFSKDGELTVIYDLDSGYETDSLASIFPQAFTNFKKEE